MARAYIVFLLSWCTLHATAESEGWSTIQVGTLGEDFLKLSPRRRLTVVGRRLLSSAPQSSFKVENCADIAGLSVGKKAVLAKHSITKCVNVFGALIAGHSGFAACLAQNNMIYMSNILAQCIDTKGEGAATDSNVVQYLNNFGSDTDRNFLLAGCTSQQEEEQDWSPFRTSYSSQGWKADGEDTGIKSVLTEEVFHFMHQTAWGKSYPVFKSIWTSHLGLCVKAAQCKWYMHPENAGCSDMSGTKCTNSEVSCAGNCANFNTPGQCFETEENCAAADCDIAEFFHKVFLTYYEDPHTEGYDLMATSGASNKAGLSTKMQESTACQQLLTDMQNTAYALPRKRLTADYSLSLSPMPTPTPTPENADSAWGIGLGLFASAAFVHVLVDR